MDDGMNIIRVLLIDKNQLSRYGFYSILSQVPDFQVVTLPDDNEIETTIISKISFDVAVIHISCSKTQYMDLLQPYINLINSKDSTPVLVIAENCDNNDVIHMVQYGVAGYLPTDTTPEELYNVIRRLYHHEFYLPTDLAYQLVSTAGKIRDMNNAHQLTPQQQKVFKMIALGKQNREIASALAISERTVEAHARQIYKKLKVANRTQAFISAVQMGLVDIHPS